MTIKYLSVWSQGIGWIQAASIFSILLFVIVLSIFFYMYKIDVVYSQEKSSSYECGFNPFEEVYGRFDVRYYLVAILFIVFDLEVVFLYPWTIVLNYVYLFGLWSMLFFLALLFVGFIYEWKRGSLDW